MLNRKNVHIYKSMYHSYKIINNQTGIFGSVTKLFNKNTQEQALKFSSPFVNSFLPLVVDQLCIQRQIQNNFGAYYTCVWLQQLILPDNQQASFSCYSQERKCSVTVLFWLTTHLPGKLCISLSEEIWLFMSLNKELRLLNSLNTVYWSYRKD